MLFSAIFARTEIRLQAVMPNVGQSATLFLCLKEKAFYYPDSQA